jgi:DNA-binding MarR family transcriptional regulator
MDDFEWGSLYQSCKEIMTYTAMQPQTMPLDPCENGVLGILEENNGGMYPSEIGKRLGIQRPSLTPVLRELEEQGLICHAPDPTDGRRNFVVLSEKYYRLREEDRQRRVARFGELFRFLPEEEARHMCVLFGKAASDCQNHDDSDASNSEIVFLPEKVYD